MKFKLLQKPNFIDCIFLSLFAILITLHPYYLRAELNLYELGLYLPGINSVLDGLIPYRDFFHLRGPMELYVPALFMRFFGENVSVLTTYFYVGTIITLIICVFICKELYRTRFVLYLMIPVFIGRTFPRVAFTFWGGMRYGLGLLSVLCCIYFLKSKKRFWIFLSGVISVLAILTSIEIGVCAIFSVMAMLGFSLCLGIQKKKFVFKSMGIYLSGVGMVLLIYGIYLFSTQSLGPYLESTYFVITRMTKIFPDFLLDTTLPKNMWQSIAGMNPFSRHFKLLTPAYCYLFLSIYIFMKMRKNKLDESHLAIMSVAFYGLILYISAFRKIGASQFEMALQPGKMLLFFMVEEFYLFLRGGSVDLKGIFQKANNRMSLWKIYGINFLIFSFIMSCLGYSVARFNHRFFAYKYVRNLIQGKSTSKLIPLAGQKQKTMEMNRLKGMTVPSWQAQNFKKLDQFIQKNTKVGESVFMYPDIGSYSFIVDRPFVGRFPVAHLSWIGVGWSKELFDDLKRTSPRFAIISKDPGTAYPKALLKVESNRKSYEQFMVYLENNYTPVDETYSLLIYQRKKRCQAPKG